MKWVDNHRGVFNVELVAVSTIHTQVILFLLHNALPCVMSKRPTAYAFSFLLILCLYISIKIDLISKIKVLKINKKISIITACCQRVFFRIIILIVI